MKKLAVSAAALVAVILSTPAWAGTTPPGAHGPMPVPRDHVELHARMTEQMRAMQGHAHMGASDWSQMRHEPHIRAEEHHQAAMDRMLARSSP